jgi:hypothetical protein
MGFPKAQTDFFPLLHRHGVPFVIVGGYAVIFHGHPRVTEDVDLVWLRNTESEVALLQALQEANACSISNEIDPQTRIERLVPVSEAYIGCHHLMMLVTDYGFVDLFDYVPGLPDADVAAFFEQSVAHGPNRYASRDWLIEMKRRADRGKDRKDLEYLEDTSAAPE